MQQLGSTSNAGGEDIHLDGDRAYVSGRYMYQTWFQLIDIADTLHPQVLGRCTLPGYKHGAWGSVGIDRALVANSLDGLALVDVSGPGDPTVDSLLLGAGSSVDIELDGDRAYLANGGGGMKALNVLDPTGPFLLGSYDTAGIADESYSVCGKDSFAYVGWFNLPAFRSIDVTDPTNPRLAGSCAAFEYAQDLAIRDTLVYAADHYKFEVVNVARPRQPEVVGTCNLPERSREVILADTLAYIANHGGIIVMNVAQPDSPHVVATWPRYIWGIDLQDTVLYALSYANANDDVLLSFSVRNPAAPLLLDTIIVPRTMHDVLVVDTVAYCAGWEMAFVDVSDPSEMRRLPGRWVQPSFYVRRLAYDPPYIYAAATDGGVCILETLQTGIHEPRPGETARALRLEPSVTPGPVRVTVGATVAAASTGVYDATGREVYRLAEDASAGLTFDLTGQPAGVYVVVVSTAGGVRFSGKLVKTRGR
jgi:hypothetical protein